MLRWFLLIVLIVSLPRAARADEVEDAFNDGKRLLGLAKWDEACDAFARAEAAGGATVRTRYQIGRCNDERGNAVLAHRAFDDAARLAEAAGDNKRAGVARQRATELQKQVALLKIVVSDDVAAMPGLRIQRDDEVVPPRELNEQVAVTPGSHRVTVSADGAETMSLSVESIVPGGSAQLVLPSLASGPVAAQNAGDAGQDVPPPAPGDATSMNSKPLFWTGFGLTIAGGLLVGAATVGFAIDRLQTEQAAIGWALGGVMLGVGIPFLVVGGRQVPVAGDTAIVIGPTGGSVRVSF